MANSVVNELPAVEPSAFLSTAPATRKNRQLAYAVVGVSLLFFLATTSLPLTRIGLALSVAALVRIPATIAAGLLSDRFGPRAAIVGSHDLVHRPETAAPGLARPGGCHV